MPITLRLRLLPGRFSICRLAAHDAVPAWAWAGEFHAVCRTGEELSIVCAEAAVPPGVRCENSWRVLQVEGPLDFALTGILASIAAPLAQAGISIFAVSTFDTDYVLLREGNLQDAAHALAAAGHAVTL